MSNGRNYKAEAQTELITDSIGRGVKEGDKHLCDPLPYLLDPFKLLHLPPEPP